MFGTLPQGIKISISRSIKTAFENYMSSIQWDENKYSFESFVRFWKEYSKKHASWFDKIDRETWANEKFHQELTNKMNETIEKIITTPPSEDEMERIELLVNELAIDDVDYCCKAEAKYHINQLENAKKKDNVTSTDKERKFAEIIYYHAFEEELPNGPHTSEEIKKFIHDAQRKLGHEEFFSNDDPEFPLH